MNIVAIAIGGMIGSVLRFWIGVFLANHETNFPLPTMIVNVIGSFILGWFIVYGAKKVKSQPVVLGIQTGLIGSFTTFSTFNVELIMLLKKGLLNLAILYFCMSVVVGLAAVIMGMRVGAANDKVGAD